MLVVDGSNAHTIHTEYTEDIVSNAKTLLQILLLQNSLLDLVFWFDRAHITNLL